MKEIVKILLLNIFVFLLLHFSLLAQEEKVLYPQKDAFISSELPNSNYGTNNILAIQNSSSNGTLVSFLYFNLSSIPDNAIISFAKLELYCSTKQNNPLLSIGAAGSGSWTETGITWSNQPGYSTSAVGYVGSENSYTEYSVLGIVRDWVLGNKENNGLVIASGSSENLAWFHSREGNYSPKLIINYEVPPSEGSLQITVKNIDGNTNPLPGSNGLIKLYDSNGSLITIESTNSDGVATFSNLPEEYDYYYDVYHNPNNPTTIFGTEYWGRRTGIGIISDQITYDTFKRNQPYTSSLKVFDNQNNQEVLPGDTVSLGTELKIIALVENPNNNGSSDHYVKTRIVIDDNKSTPYEFDQTSAQQSILKGSNNEFIFYFTPRSIGAFYNLVGTLTEDVYTDGWSWTELPTFVVEPSVGSIYSYSPPFLGASLNHRQEEIEAIWGRRVGAVPSEYDPKSGQVHHRSAAAAQLFGGTNWYVLDEIVFPIEVEKSGYYKITFKGNLSGYIAAGRVGEIGHCAHYLGVTAGIYGLGSTTYELRNTLNEDWPSSLDYFTKNAALKVLSVLFPSGWASVFLSAAEVALAINDLREQLEDIRIYSNTTLGDNGLTLYGNLESGYTYNAAFWVWSNNLVGTSAGLVTSIIDVTAELDELILEELNTEYIPEPDSPSLVSPLNGSSDIVLSPTLIWQTADRATSYHLQVSSNSNFSQLIYDEPDIVVNSFQISNLSYGTEYFWKVIAQNNSGSSNSESWSFVTTLGRHLTITSQNPDQDVNIQISKFDNKGDKNGITPFNRIYDDNTSLELIAPETMNGSNFQVWLRNGSEYSSDSQINLTLNADYTMTAVYDSLTSIIEIDDKIPTKYYLYQNYPNPFNPTTIIKFQIPKRNFVTVDVISTLGEKIITLVKKELPAGNYSIDFDASGLPSGIYLYRLITNEYIKTEKALFIK